MFSFYLAHQTASRHYKYWIMIILCFLCITYYKWQHIKLSLLTWKYEESMYISSRFIHMKLHLLTWKIIHEKLLLSTSCQKVWQGSMETKCYQKFIYIRSRVITISISSGSSCGEEKPARMPPPWNRWPHTLAIHWKSLRESCLTAAKTSQKRCYLKHWVYPVQDWGVAVGCGFFVLIILVVTCWGSTPLSPRRCFECRGSLVVETSGRDSQGWRCREALE